MGQKAKYKSLARPKNYSRVCTRRVVLPRVSYTLMRVDRVSILDLLQLPRPQPWQDILGPHIGRYAGVENSEQTCRTDRSCQVRLKFKTGQTLLVLR